MVLNVRLSIVVILFALFLAFVILYLFRKNTIPVKYAIIWLCAILVIFICSIIPNFLQHLSSFIGFEVLSNMILCMFIGFLLFITLILTVMMAGQKKKTTLLIQEISILKKELEDKE